MAIADRRPSPPGAFGETARAARAVPAAVPWALIAFGAALRVFVYARERSLWHDEARLALNLIERSYGGLLQQLDYNQAAPPGFLVVERLAVQALGEGEHALRLFPLLCALASLPLFWTVASRLLLPWGAVAGLALFAFAEPLLYYAAEVKQYGVDVAATLAVLYLAARVREPDAGTREVAALAVIGPVLVWFSHASALVLAGVMVALVSAAALRREWRRLRHLAAAGGLWVGSLLAYGFLASDAARNVRRGFREGLPDSFAPVPPQSLEELRWYPAIVHGFSDALGAPRVWAVLGLAVALAGAVSLLRRDGVGLAFLLAPAVALVLASGLELYPMEFRFLLFVVPIAFLLVGEGLGAARRHAGPIAAFALFVAVAWSPARATGDLIADGGRQEIRPLLKVLQQQARAGDSLYVYHPARYALAYYAECDDCGTAGLRAAFPLRRGDGDHPIRSSPPEVVVGSSRSAEQSARVDDLRSLGPGRAWVLFTQFVRPDGVDERTLFVAELDRLGRRLSAREARGAALYLYDLRE